MTGSNAAVTHDPLLSGLPPASELVVNDGSLKMPLELHQPAIHRRLLGLRNRHHQQILSWSSALDIPVLPLSSGHPVAKQLRQVLGRAAGEC